jgi:hypothetical protein
MAGHRVRFDPSKENRWESGDPASEHGEIVFFVPVANCRDNQVGFEKYPRCPLPDVAPALGVGDDFEVRELLK